MMMNKMFENPSYIFASYMPLSYQLAVMYQNPTNIGHMLLPWNQYWAGPGAMLKVVYH